MSIVATPSRDRKTNDSLLAPFERRFADWLVPLVPRFVGAHHLTMATAVWSALVLLTSWLTATHGARWLAATSGLIVVQYVTDAIDGKVGKTRGAGLVRWGYYMDHFLDHVFLCSILVGYALLLPADRQFVMVLVIAVSSGFMVSAFLARAVTGELPISYLHLGPIEMRLIFIAINTWLMTWGRGYMVAVVPYVVAAAVVVLATLVYRTQRMLWRLDAHDARALTLDEDVRARGARAGAGVRTET